MKCGVTAMDLVPESSVQSSLFDHADRRKNREAMRAVDQINQKIGKDVLRAATQGFERPYRLKTDYLSRRYTTRMSEILSIKN